MKKREGSVEYNSGQVGDLIRPANDVLSTDLRRYQRRLRASGAGVLYFAIWGVCRLILLAIFTEDNFVAEGVEELNADPVFAGSRTAAMVGIIIVMTIFLGIGVLLRYSVFAAARRESLGIQKNRFYIVLAVFMLLLSITSISSFFIAFLSGNTNNAPQGTSLLVETANAYTLAELIHSSFKLRKLRKQSGE